MVQSACPPMKGVNMLSKKIIDDRLYDLDVLRDSEPWPEPAYQRFEREALLTAKQLGEWVTRYVETEFCDSGPECWHEAHAWVDGLMKEGDEEC